MRTELALLFWMFGGLALCAAQDAAMPGGGGAMLVGAPKKADVNDPGVQKALSFATEHINNMDNSLFYRIPLNVEEVETQVVSGILYHFRGVRMASTSCTKSSVPSNLKDCAVTSKNSARDPVFDFKVWSQPWMPTPYRVLNFKTSDMVKCAVDIHQVCPGWTLDKSGVCLLVPDDKLPYAKAQEECQARGGKLIEKNDVTDGVRLCLADIHPLSRPKMVWLVGRKQCSLYDLKGQGIRYPGCSKRRYYVCIKDALPVPTTVPTTELPLDMSSTSLLRSETSSALPDDTGMELEIQPEQTVTMGRVTDTPTTTGPYTTSDTTAASTEMTETQSTEMQTDITTPLKSTTFVWDSWEDIHGFTSPTFEVPTVHIDPTEPQTTFQTSELTSFPQTSGQTTGAEMTSETAVPAGSGGDSRVNFETTYTLTYDKSSTSGAGQETSAGTSMAAETPEVQTSAKVPTLPPIPDIPKTSTRDKPRLRPAQSEGIRCPESFFAASDTLCLSIVQEKKSELGEAVRSCVDKGAQLMRLDLLTDSIKNQLQARVSFEEDEKLRLLRLEKQDCVLFNEDQVEEATCSAGTKVGYICAIDHARTGGSTMNKAVPVAGATFAVTSIAILVYHTLKARRSS